VIDPSPSTAGVGCRPTSTLPTLVDGEGRLHDYQRRSPRRGVSRTDPVSKHLRSAPRSAAASGARSWLPREAAARRRRSQQGCASSPTSPAIGLKADFEAHSDIHLPPRVLHGGVRSARRSAAWRR
jgi:hypothetical protein